jgi:AP-3 complex subunit delta-1
MGFSLYNLFKSGLLITNAIAILHPKRFLAKYGYDRMDPSSGASMQNQIVGFLTAVAYLKIPLIIVNCLVIMIEMVAG